MNGARSRRWNRPSPGTSRLLIALFASLLPLDWIQGVGAMDTASMPRMKMPGMKMSGDLMRTAVAGPYRIELHVLPPEPFYSAAEAATKHPAAGMLIVGGATPLAPDANPAPDHHLIIHVFAQASGQAVAHAAVSLSFRRADSAGRPIGKPVHVPVVVMQAIGGGAASTHYGNNVHMAPGAYIVTVVVNGTPATFQIKL